jgi:fatty-acyl-CoA synthase
LALVAVHHEFSATIGREAIRAHLDFFVKKGTLSRFAIPERIVFVDTLPETSLGKIDKKKLREIYRK